MSWSSCFVWHHSVSMRAWVSLCACLTSDVLLAGSDYFGSHSSWLYVVNLCLPKLFDCGLKDFFLTAGKAQEWILNWMLAEFHAADSVSGSWCCACWLTHSGSNMCFFYISKLNWLQWKKRPDLLYMVKLSNKYVNIDKICDPVLASLLVKQAAACTK